jgi:hypothetical protein
MSSEVSNALQCWFLLRVDDPKGAAEQCLELEQYALSTSCLSPWVLEQLWAHKVHGHLDELLKHRMTMGFFCASLSFPEDIEHELKCKRNPLRYESMVAAFQSPQLNSAELAKFETFSEQLFFTYGKIQKHRPDDFQLLCQTWEPRVCYTALKLYSMTPNQHNLPEWLAIASAALPALQSQIQQLNL